MDRNTIIGFLLIFAVLIGWQQYNKPIQEARKAEALRQDSLARVQDSLHNEELDAFRRQMPPEETEATDTSVAAAQQQAATTTESNEGHGMDAAYGPFAGAAEGIEKEQILENDQVRITFTNKGGRIKSVELLQYQRVVVGEKHEEHKEPLILMANPENRFSYALQVPTAGSGTVPTDALFFDGQLEGNTLTFRAYAGTGKYFEQKYTLPETGFDLQYELSWKGLEDIVSPSQDMLPLSWVNYLAKLEKSVRYEKTYSTIYYKPLDEDVEHLSYMKDDRQTSEAKPVEWVANTNQFFQSTLIGEEKAFSFGEFAISILPDGSDYIKKCETRLDIPFKEQQHFSMRWYIGPNDFDILQAHQRDLEYTVAYGSSILGTINRWIVRPIFNFLSSFVGSMGLAIFLLTLIVKLLLYPLAYKMLYQQSKMAALKPIIEKVKERFKDDAQQQQVETMKLYQEYGVNPLGGCLPTLLQMPIWIALYRFFPAAIEFRQKGFLWATDLSSYDVAFTLPFTIPAYGDHVSLFTLLWVATTILYTYYNSKHMDMSANPAMKYVQYFMPVMFLFFFNNYAAGLTVYLLFSNILNIAQTLITKNYIVDQEKIKRELEAAKAKPKKKGGFRERLQKAMEEQQRVAEQQKKKKKK